MKADLHIPSTPTALDRYGASYECGCSASRGSVDLCPMHRAAPQMYKALKDALIFIDYLCEISTLKNASVRMMGGYQNIQTGIAAAEGK